MSVPAVAKETPFATRPVPALVLDIGSIPRTPRLLAGDFLSGKGNIDRDAQLQAFGPCSYKREIGGMMRLFGRRERPHPLAEMPVWVVPLHVQAGTEQLPAPLIGAYVQVFCRGDNSTTAAWAAIQAVEAMGYSVPDSPTTVNRMPAADYDTFVSSQWPEQRAALPSQAEFYESMAEYRTVFGPFGGYDTPASNS